MSELNPKAETAFEIEPNAKTNATNEFINGVHLKETQDVINEELNEYFEDGKHLDDVGNIADESAIWVYFGVGGPA
jgi:hypothetical protein